LRSFSSSFEFSNDGCCIVDVNYDHVGSIRREPFTVGFSNPRPPPVMTAVFPLNFMCISFFIGKMLPIFWPAPSHTFKPIVLQREAGFAL